MAGMFRPYPIDWDAGDLADGDEQTVVLTAALKGHEEPLGDNAPFVRGPRAKRNVAWGWALFIMYAAGIIVLCVMAFYRNANFDELISDEATSNPANCPPASGRQLLMGSSPNDMIREETSLLRHPVGLVLWIVATLSMCAIVGTIVLRLFEANSHGMVKAVAAIQLCVPLILSLAMFATSRAMAGILLLVWAAVSGLCIYIWRDTFPLLARLISVACSAIADNPNLFWYSFLAHAVFVINLVLYLYTASISLGIGSLVPNPIAFRVDSSCRSMLSFQEVPCCWWQPSLWAVLALVPLYLAVLWAAVFILECLTYVISGTVSQWYFASAASSSCQGNAARSLRHMGTSTGTLALGSLVLFWVRFARTFTYVNDRRLTWRNPISYCFAILCLPYFCISCCITPCIDHITKYGTHHAAIQGYGFFHSSSLAYNMLRRNHMNAIGLGWAPPLILRFSVATVAAAIGIAADPSIGTMYGGLRANVVVTTLFFALGLAGVLLLGALDSLYVCFALDREQQQCTNNEVHAIFTSMPAVGPIWDDKPGNGSGVALGVPATYAAVPNEAGTSGQQQQQQQQQQQYAAPSAQRVPQPSMV